VNSRELTEVGPRRLTARLEGEEVLDGTILVDRLVVVLSNLQLAVRHIAEDIAGRRRKRGPFPRTIAEQTALRLIAIAEGSWEATLELERPPQLPGFRIGEEALERFLDDVHEIQEEGVSRVCGPAEAEIRSLLHVVGDGVTALTLTGGPKQRLVRFDAEMARQLVAVEEVSVPRKAVLSGRLREVDYKDGTAELYDASGQMTRVAFSRDQEGLFETAANKMVLVDGESQEGMRGTPRIQAERIRVLDLQTTGERRTARQLAEERHIPPFTRAVLDEADFWPSDEDPHEFIRWIYEERQKGSAGSDGER